MLLVFDNVLTGDQVAQVHAELRDEDFEDGRKTAGWHARLVKKNSQMTAKNERTDALRAMLIGAITGHKEFVRAFRPRAVRPLIINRYTEGMAYGPHVDDPFMGGRNMIRTDLSMTLFLSAPDSYEGGELIAESSLGERRFKLPPGHMVVYPATTLHQVAPITAGTRLAAVAWGQSLIRDPVRREMIYDLDNARREMFSAAGKTPAFDLISKTHANLLRMWSEF